MSANDFIYGMRRIVYPVCIASATNKDEKFALTVSSVTSVSIDPPTLLVCINKSSSMVRSIKTNSFINVNFLNGSQDDIADTCSKKDTANMRFIYDDWLYDANKLPYLDKSELVAFCKVTEIVSHATHLVVFLSVDHVIIGSGIEEANPLLYQNGKYKHLKNGA